MVIDVDLHAALRQRTSGATVGTDRSRRQYVERHRLTRAAALDRRSDHAARQRVSRKVDDDYVERHRADRNRGIRQYHYPSIIQAADGTLHVTYSYFIASGLATRDVEGRTVRKSIKHAHFNEVWIRTRENADRGRHRSACR